MYLHIGKNIMIPFEEIIIIGDLKSLKESKISKEFLKYLQDKNPISIKKDSEKKYRTVIVTSKETYYSIISSNTLKERVSRKY